MPPGAATTAAVVAYSSPAVTGSASLSSASSAAGSTGSAGICDRGLPVSFDSRRARVSLSAALAAFAENFHPRLIALTGSQDAIDDAKTKFSVSAIKGEVRPNGAYEFEHTTFTYLFAPDGSPLGIIPTDKGPQGVAAELERWVR